jgi:hypothetical protein
LMGLKNRGVMIPNGTTQGYFHLKATFYKH